MSYKESQVLSKWFFLLLFLLFVTAIAAIVSYLSANCYKVVVNISLSLQQSFIIKLTTSVKVG